MFKQAICCELTHTFSVDMVFAPFFIYSDQFLFRQRSQRLPFAPNLELCNELFIYFHSFSTSQITSNLQLSQCDRYTFNFCASTTHNRGVLYWKMAWSMLPILLLAVWMDLLFLPRHGGCWSEKENFYLRKRKFYFPLNIDQQLLSFSPHNGRNESKAMLCHNLRWIFGCYCRSVCVA